MSERNLLASCIASREAFETIQPHLEKGDLSEQSDIVLREVREYYDRDVEAGHCDPDLLRSAVCRRMSNPKHKEMFGELVDTLTSTDCSPSNVLHDFIAVRREAAGGRLASALAAGRDSNDVRPLVDEYLKWDEATELEEDKGEILNGVLPSTLAAELNEEGLIELWPTSLNRRLDGGLLRGHHVLIFARPEMGKTMMLVNMMAGFCAQNLRTLYVGNEEPIQDTMIRVQSRLTGMTKTEILEDVAFADDVVLQQGYDNLYFREAAPGTPGQIANWLEEVQPDVLIIDQLRNLNVGEDNFTRQLEKAAIAARNLGKSHNVLVVSVTQAGDSASGKGALDMGDVDSSNTGIPAACDVMVGLGASADDEASNRRVISLPKNKRGGRHEFFPVRVEPQISNIRSLQ